MSRFRKLVKSLCDAIAGTLVLPLVAAYRVGALLLGTNRAFPGWSQALSLIPGLTGVYLRRAFYRWVLPRCGRDACISFGTVFSHPTAEIGDRVYIGVYCVLGDVTLEDDVLVASQVSIANGSQQHGIDRLDVPIREQPGTWPRIRIGRDSWIGERAVVLADVGAQCVVAAGAVVTRPLPERAIAAGVPARIIRFRGDPSAPAPNDHSNNATSSANSHRSLDHGSA
ncbi:MAG: acyltransferase [Gemmataceae bacterium]